MSDEVRVDDLKDLWRAGKVNLPTVAVHDARPQPEYPELNGATVEQVVASVEQALNALRRIMDGEEAFIAEPVNALIEKVEPLLTDRDPTIVGGILPNEPVDKPGVTRDKPSLDDFRPRS